MVCVAALAVISGAAGAVPPATGLKAVVQDGQVFLSWQEGETPEGTTWNVYLSDAPITDVAWAKCIAHHIERHSARDWWEDPTSFKKGESAKPPVGFRIEDTGERIDPSGGLFVHTPRKEGKLFFAVTCTESNGVEDTALVPGANALQEGIAVTSGKVRAIWQRPGAPPASGAGKGRALWLRLHGKSDVVRGAEYLAFGDETMGWREGIPFKFSVRIQGDAVVIQPTDRTWINRPHPDGAGADAIWTFWYGYNSRIYDPKQMSQGVPTNYTEQRLMWILNWVSERYQTDRTRWYCSGSSMGGCGTVSFALRQPNHHFRLRGRLPPANKDSEQERNRGCATKRVCRYGA